LRVRGRPSGLKVAYHLLAQAGTPRAPSAITTIVSCLPVLVLAMGTALAHMLHADARAASAADDRARGPATPGSPAWSPGDQSGPGPGQDAGRGTVAASGPAVRARWSPGRDQDAAAGITAPALGPAQQKMDQARLVAGRLAAAGKPVSRRALRSAGLTGSNQALNALARKVNAELAGAGTPGDLRPAAER
jgi:hypothetical protein